MKRLSVVAVAAALSACTTPVDPPGDEGDVVDSARCADGGIAVGYPLRPGNVVVSGELLAKSGNSGFSSAPHLHFAVVDAAMQSLPMCFEPDDAVPATGDIVDAVTSPLTDPPRPARSLLPADLFASTNVIVDNDVTAFEINGTVHIEGHITDGKNRVIVVLAPFGGGTARTTEAVEVDADGAFVVDFDAAPAISGPQQPGRRRRLLRQRPRPCRRHALTRQRRRGACRDPMRTLVRVVDVREIRRSGLSQRRRCSSQARSAALRGKTLLKDIVVNAFTELSLLPTLLDTLAELNLVRPTEIQQRALPLLLEGRSVVGVAETGSGKTLAYALPILHALKTLEIKGSRVEINARPRAVVIVPTRELGEQVAKVFKPFTHTTRLRVRTVLGGTDIDIAKKNIAGAFEVLVATPGRVGKLLDRGLLRFDDVRILVFDEADQMLDQGFLPDATKIAAECPPNRQLALFSATVSSTVQKLMNQLFENAEVIRSGGSHRVPSTLTTINRAVVNGERLPHLQQLLSEPVVGGTMLFTNTREQCDALAEQIHVLGRTYALYRGEMDKLERRNNLKAFRDGVVDLLVSTDLAGRGLDVEHVGRVINYHLPKELENYLHRVGRTARAGRAGVVINLVTERDAPLLEQIEALNQGKKSSLPAKPDRPAKPAPAAPPMRTTKAALERAAEKLATQPAKPSSSKPSSRPAMPATATSKPTSPRHSPKR